MSNLKSFLSKAKAMSRSTLSVVLALCLLMMMIPTVLLVAADEVWNGTDIATGFAGGDGSQATPFRIETGAQLAFLAKQVNEGTTYTGTFFQMMNNIDLGGNAWTPIGGAAGGTGKRFMGHFDGNGFTIAGLSVSGTARYVGLFGYVQLGSIKNLTVQGTVTSSGNSVGGIVGGWQDGATMTNCAFIGTVTTTGFQTGGLIGTAPQGATIKNCYTAGGTVSCNASGQIGGLAGTAGGASLLVENCYSTMTVSCTAASAGGLVGSASAGTVTINNAFFVGTMDGTNNPIAGTATAGATLTKVYYKTESITGTASGVLTNVAAYTANQFEDGTVLALLNDGAELWEQGEFYPIFARLPQMTNLEVGGNLISFSQSVTDYYLFLENSVTSLTVKPTVDNNTTLKVGNETVTSGTAVTVPLTANATTVIKVTITRIENGKQKVYTINAYCGPTWDGAPASSFAGGDGSQADPFRIETGGELAYLAKQVNEGETYTGKFFQLTNNIQLGGHAWTPIGGSKQFKGHFDGNGFTIAGLNVSASGRYSGLFGFIAAGSIKNLTVEGNVSSSANSVGGIVGGIQDGATLTNCAFIGNVSSTGVQVGGLVGTASQGVTLINCYAIGGTVSGTGQVGGLAGNVAATFTVNNCYSDMTVDCSVTATTGGLVGAMSAASGIANMTNAFFVGTVTATNGAPISGNAPASSTLTKVYYKTDSITGNASGLLTDATAYTGDEFKNGTVLALLNNDGNAWAQGESYPVFAKAPKMTNLEVGNNLITFSEGVTNYDLFLENSVTSLSVKPTVEAGTSVTVNGATVNSGESVQVPLTANAPTTIEVKIARQGTEKTYTIYVFCGTLWDGTTATPYPNANEPDAGTKENPYEIALPEHLAYMAQQINLGNGQTAHYELVANIVLANELWTPIGKVVDGADRPFSGIFNGNGYTIGGLNYYYDVVTDADEDGVPDAVDTYNATSATDRNSGGVGLFGIAKNATIKNLNVRGSVVTDQFTVAALIGRAPGSVTIQNCHVNGKVKSGSNNYLSFTGGLIGTANADSTINIIDSSFTGSVEADATKYYTYTSADDTTLKLNTQSAEYIGGFIGYVANATVYVSDSYVNADVNTPKANATGGMIGGVDVNSNGGFTNVSLERCYSSGTVTGNRVGGLVGWLRDDSTTANGKGAKLTMKDCYSDAELVSASTATAGLTGGARFDGSAEDVVIQMENCFYAGYGAGVPVAYHLASGERYSVSTWDIDVTTPGYTPSSYANNLYYLAGSYISAANDITNGTSGAEKSADDMKSQAFVDLLNANAGKTVWALGADHPVLLSFPKLDNIALNQGTIEFSPILYDYQVYVSNKYDSITITPTTEDSSVTIKVNGNTVVSGQASAEIALSEDVATEIKVDVTLGAATTTYTIRAMLTEAWDGTYEPFDATQGKGSTMENPILINTPGQLAFLSAMANGIDVTVNGKLYPAPKATAGKVYNGVYFEITADLLMNVIDDYENWDIKAPANDFEPIAHHSDTQSESRTFGGIVNGNEHKIIGLYVKGSEYGGVAGVGLFGSVDGAILRNIHIEKSYVTGSQRVGGLVGRPRTSITVQNCSFSGTIRGTFVHQDHATLAGGLLGDSVARTVLNSCWTEGKVIGGNGIGGLIGQLYMQTGLEIKNCYSAMTLEAPDGYTAGGLIGILGGKAGSVDVYRSHFAGHVPTNTPFIGAKSATCSASVTSSDTLYYREGSYEGQVNSELTYGAIEKSAEEFADGTMADLLNSLVEYGDYWKWKTGANGYPVSDGVLLVTDYRDHTSDKYYDDGNWYEVFENKPGGTLKNPSDKGDSGITDDYLNSETGETSLFSAALILALISAVSAFLLARRKRSIN